MEVREFYMAKPPWAVSSTGLYTFPLYWKLSAKHLFHRALEQPSRLAGGVSILRTHSQMNDLLETPALVLGSLTLQLLRILPTFFCLLETELFYMSLAVLELIM